MTKSQVREVIIIEWIDASMTNNTDTYTHDEACEECLMHGFACGVLINETKKYYTIARDWFDESNNYRGIATYPKSGVVNFIKYKILESK